MKKKSFYWLLGAAILSMIVYASLPQPIEVDIKKIIRGPLKVTIDEDGKTRIRDHYIVSTPLTGYLLRIGRRIGDKTIAKKTLLATIESNSPTLLDKRTQAERIARIKAAKANNEQATAQFNRVQAELKLAEAEYKRVQGLYQQGLVSKKEYDKTTTLLQTWLQERKRVKFTKQIAKFELELAKATLAQNQNQERMHLNIYSPINGQILRIFRESAASVDAGTPLLELGDTNDLEIVTDVLSTDAVKITPGNSVIIENWGGTSLEGRVKSIEPSAFTKISVLGVEEQRVNVIIDFQNPPQRIGDGYRVQTRIVIWQHKNILKVPVGALFRQQSKWAVFRIVEGKAELQLVQIGYWGKWEAEVVNGLKENDKVIVYPGDKIKHGIDVIAFSQ